MIIFKDRRHHHYWIDGGKLFETYKTIRGLRYRFLIEVDFPDKDCLSEEDIKTIEVNIGVNINQI